ncbi:MAG: DNA polymerase/3'-5' exonuclease PolX [Phycisphaerales bacterium]|nr:DNA polymerase/3'-5' exonuclease PolX [Phycisphaerales bacterium]
MSFNSEVALRLERIAVMLDLLGEDSFRSAANARAARAIADLATDLAPIADDQAKLRAIQGIGPKIAEKIGEFHRTGRIEEHDELVTKVPPGLFPLLEVPGLGPKTLRTLWTQGGVTDRASLDRIIADGSILSLPRMGEKSVRKLKDSLAFASSPSNSRLPLGMAMPLAEAIVEHLRGLPGAEHVSYAGSLRRGRDTVGDLDFLVGSDDAHAPSILRAFAEMPLVSGVLVHGETKCSVRLRLESNSSRWGEDQAGPPAREIQADLRVVDDSCFGAALMYFTGSKDHNVAMRQRALSRGLTLNEYGLFPNDDGPTPPQARGVKPVAAKTERQIYGALALPEFPPEIRENRGEMDLAEVPSLISIDEIRAELHAHTTASDGRLSILELAAEAKRRGFHTIAVTDHSKSSAVAGGLSPERLREHIKAVHAARNEIDGITILAGSEVDILADGELDYDDELLAKLDIVVASIHAGLSQDGATATKRLLRVIQHPLVHIIGHPTGRLVNRRPGLSPDMGEITAAAREHRVVLEINAHWMRLDLRDTHVKAAVDAGCLLSIDCDVHEREDFDNLRYGILTGRRGWLPTDRCINTWAADRLHAFLREKRSGREPAKTPPSRPHRA